MARDDYIQHAHRHDPKGTDPLDISFLTDAVGAATTAGLPVCYAYTTSPFTVTADGAWHSPDWDSFTTNNTSVFTLNAGDHSMIHFEAGYYLVGYQAYMATLPTSPDYVASIVSELGSESGTIAGRGVIGDWVKANTVTADYYSAGEITAGLKSWQNFQLFQLAPDAPTAGGFYHVLFEKASGANATIDTVLFYAVRLSGSADAVGSTGGIFFDTNNIGDWLSTETTGVDPSSITTSIDTYGDVGTGIVADGHDLLLASTGNGNVNIDSPNSLKLNAGPLGSLYLNGPGGSNFFANGFTGGYFFNDGYFLYDGSGFEVDADDGVSLASVQSTSTQGVNITDNGTGGINLSATQSNMVVDLTAGKVQIKVNGVTAFEVRHDGTIHALSGGSIHFDL